MNKKQKKILSNTVLYIISIAIAIFMFCPIIWILSGGFKTTQEFTTSANIIPQIPTLKNFIFIFTKSKLWLYTRNTLLLIVGNGVGTLLSSSLVAYALARMDFKWKNVIFTIIVATMMVPNIALIIPQYIMFGKIGWLDSLLPMIVPSFFAYPYNVFLLRQYFRSIPKELDEAATIDGCNSWQIFTKIIVPISKPTFVTIAVLSAVYWWNELTQPVFYINSDQWRTLTMALMSTYMYTDNTFAINWPSIMAASTLMVVPPMILYSFAGKYLTGGIKTTGLK